jgi:hypothetical protein
MPILGFAAIALLVLSVYLVARRRAPAPVEAIPLSPPRPSWTASLGGSDVAPQPQERIALVERLGVVGSAWCVSVLERALEDEHDARVRDAAWRTLLALRTEFP